MHALLGSNQFNPILSASDPNLLQYQIINCSEENQTIKLESNNNIWIEVINTTNETGYVVSNCVFDYCVQKQSTSV